MGLDQSRPLTEWECEDVATSIAKLGKQYASYSDAILENSVDGYLLSSLSPSEISETLDDLEIVNRLHRRVIEKKLLTLIEESGSSTVTTEPKKKYLVPKSSDNSNCSVDSRDEETDRTESETEDPGETPMSPEEAERKRIMDFMAAAQEQQMRERDALMARESALTSQIQSMRIQPTME